MKLIVKIMIALALLGGILLGIGLRSGGELYTGLRDGELLSPNRKFDSASTHGNASILDYESIDTIFIDVQGGSCEIEMGKELGYSSEVDMTVDGSVVTFTVNGGDADITLPEKSFGAIIADISGGKLEADRLNAVSRTDDKSFFGDIEINVSGGAVEIDQIWARNASVNGSLGSIEIDQIDTMIGCNLNLSAGQLSVEELYVDQLTALCEGGNMELGLPYAPETYRCTADISAGACTWNGGALDKAGFGGADAENTLDLTVSAGAIGLHRAEKD